MAQLLIPEAVSCHQDGGQDKHLKLLFNHINPSSLGTAGVQGVLVLNSGPAVPLLRELGPLPLPLETSSSFFKRRTTPSGQHSGGGGREEE